MKHLRVGAIVVLILAAASLAAAQGAPQQPKPGPELEKLGVFAGTWKVAGQYLTEPKGLYEGTMGCEWFTGGFALVCKGDLTGNRGPSSALYIFGYSAQDKAYTWYSSGSAGTGRTVLQLHVDGNKWTCDNETPYQGKPAKYHYDWVIESPSSYTYKMFRSVDGAAPVQVYDVKMTRIR